MNTHPRASLSLIVASALVIWGCGGKKTPATLGNPAQGSQSSCSDPSNSGSSPSCYPSQSPSPGPTSDLNNGPSVASAYGCIVVSSPNPAQVGSMILINVFTPSYSGLALSNFGTAAGVRARFGGIYNQTTGTMAFSAPGNYPIYATAQDGTGTPLNCQGMQSVTY